MAEVWVAVSAAVAAVSAALVVEVSEAEALQGDGRHES